MISTWLAGGDGGGDGEGTVGTTSDPETSAEEVAVGFSSAVFFLSFAFTSAVVVFVRFFSFFFALASSFLLLSLRFFLRQVTSVADQNAVCGFGFDPVIC